MTKKNQSSCADILTRMQDQAAKFRIDSGRFSLDEQIALTKEDRTTVAALIADDETREFRPTDRGVTLSDPRPLDERLKSCALQFGNETIFARTVASLLLEAHAVLADNKTLREAVDGLKFDAYELALPELSEAFGGAKAIHVLQVETLKALREAMDRT